MQITTHLTSSEHGFDDFDVLGLPHVHRVCVGHGIKNGDIFNVYCDDGCKLGATWRDTLVDALCASAGDLTLDLAAVTGSGPHGRIVRADVEGVQPGAVKPAAAPVTAPAATPAAAQPKPAAGVAATPAAPGRTSLGVASAAGADVGAAGAPPGVATGASLAGRACRARRPAPRAPSSTRLLSSAA